MFLHNNLVLNLIIYFEYFIFSWRYKALTLMKTCVRTKQNNENERKKVKEAYYMS